MAKQETKYTLEKRKPGKAKAFFICLGIAAFLWVVHSLNKIYFYSLKVPVEFKNSPRNKQPQFQLPEQLSVDIKVSGLRLALILLQRPFKPLELDFNTLKSNNRNNHYVLSGSHLNFKQVFGFETQIKHISPDTLYFSENIGLQKYVPVKVPLYVKCEDGYGYQKPVISPAIISIWGDTAVVANIDTMYTAAFNLNKLNRNIDTKLEVIRPNASVYTSINEVNLKIEVDRLVQQSIVLPLSDIAPKASSRIQIFPSTVKLSFTSMQNSAVSADTSQFRVYINSEKVQASTQKCKVIIGRAPANVTVLAIEPSEVEILRFNNK